MRKERALITLRGPIILEVEYANNKIMITIIIEVGIISRLFSRSRGLRKVPGLS